MTMLLVKLFFLIAPLRLLPPLHKKVNGNQIWLNEKELRDRYTESVSNRIKQKLQQANFINNFLKRQKETRERNKHFLLIGELCVAFSNLEQEIKEFLRNFDSDEKNDYKSGKNLSDALEKALKNSTIDSAIKGKIRDFLQEYSQIAEERNNALKVLYSYKRDSQKIIKVNMRSFKNFRQAVHEWDDFIANAFQDFDKEGHRNLIGRVNLLFVSLIKIRAEIMKTYMFHNGEIYLLEKNPEIGKAIYPLTTPNS